jgi:hypothetical protein
MDLENASLEQVRTLVYQALRDLPLGADRVQAVMHVVGPVIVAKSNAIKREQQAKEAMRRRHAEKREARDA